LGPLLLGLSFIAVAGVLVVSYLANLRHTEDIGITTLVAALLTFVLGAVAALGEPAVAAAFAVLTTLLLSFKPVLHRWLRALQAEELHAGLELLLISVVLLPVLPNRGFGPWQALNPYQIWWMVVLIAGISFLGYFIIKIAGPRKGTVLTGLSAGLVSSTALTLHFARLARPRPLSAPLLATGILIACGTMFPRMLLVATIVEPALFRPLLGPALVMAGLIYAPALLYWRRTAGWREPTSVPVENPLELKAAVGFGVLLALVMLAGEGLKLWLGDAGVLMLSAASGVADVDAITLSLARMAQGDLSLETAATGVVIAAAVNGLVKAGIAAVIGGRELGWRVGVPLVLTSAGGLLAVRYLLW
ncbi:MAG TPA: MgtC/SapB family protein, partial [Gammaproteobacteria bacterium]|nr:MgtC/SapB family protein [Gammaproteobacteria bacterium]